MEQYQVNIDPGRCVGCGLCAKVCAAHNIVMEEHRAKTLSNSCILCAQCTAVCPQKAVTVSGYDDGQVVEKREEVRLDPDKVLEVLRFRRSVRQFRRQPVPPEVIGQILEAGRLTHTAKNAQDVSFVVLDKAREPLEQMAVKLFRKLKPFADLTNPMSRNVKIDDHFFFFHAPAVIVILAEDRTNGLLAAQNMEFVAEAHGLGVLFSGFFTMAANASPNIKKALAIPKGKRVAMTLVLGYPQVKFLRSAPRKALDVRYL